jgi:hypothetical protein
LVYPGDRHCLVGPHVFALFVGTCIDQLKDFFAS